MPGDDVGGRCASREGDPLRHDVRHRADEQLRPARRHRTRRDPAGLSGLRTTELDTRRWFRSWWAAPRTGWSSTCCRRRTSRTSILDEVDAPLAGPAWAEGWHPDAQLDYVTTLGVTKSQFTEADEAAAAARIYDMLELDQPISVFATSSGPPQADSAHLIHRNATNADGAIVLSPDTAPHYLLTAFDEQSF